MMAGYNNFYPVTYQNPYQPQSFFGFQPQQAQLPQVQTQQMGNQLPITQSGILWVTSEAEAQNYPVAPNNAVALWDSSRPAIYLKQADASGKPVMKVYDLVERTEKPRDAFSASGSAEPPSYVTKAEFDTLAAAVDEMRKELDRKPAPARKKEVKDDDA